MLFNTNAANWETRFTPADQLCDKEVAQDFKISSKKWPHINSPEEKLKATEYKWDSKVVEQKQGRIPRNKELPGSNKPTFLLRIMLAANKMAVIENNLNQMRILASLFTIKSVTRHSLKLAELVLLLNYSLGF